jgi:hypothetical protein
MPAAGSGAWHGGAVQVRIIGTDLPGDCDDGGAPGGGDHRGVQVGVQRGRAVEQLVSAGAQRAVFDIELRPKGDRDALGPYAQGKPGERFVYLVWVHGPAHAMFRRAKLMLSDIPAAVWRSGLAGEALEAELGLTDACGRPLCARVPPDHIRWRAR